jgi:1,4-dihydroxy-2-naphthoate octaprenyltransferase
MEKERIKIWIEAFRLRTLPLALSCIFMGSFLAKNDGKFRYDIFFLSVLTTILLQVLSNLANDYGDSIHGADSAERKGPSRAVQTGAITKISMKRAMIFFASLAFFIGLLLLIVALKDNRTLLFIFLGIGVMSIIAAINYTTGKKPYGYMGLGDLAVLIFFGIVGVGGTYFLQTKTIDLQIFLPALSCGLLATGVLNINNIRDIESDESAGKNSIPVRIGRKNAVIYHWMLLLGSIVLASIYTWYNFVSYTQLLFLLTLPLLFINAKAVKEHTDASAIDPYLKQLALSTLAFVLTFGLGLILSA